jgi:spermidine synthase
MMNLEETSGPAAGLGVGQRWLPALLVLFIGSGCAALIYEVVWFQLLQLSIGSSTVSLSVLLGVFMGGMCLGSLLLPRYLNRRQHPLQVYAYLELGIGLFGLIVLFLVPFLGNLYTKIAGSGGISVVLRALVASICLIPPTLLMGATLPAIGRWVETTPKGVAWLGFFYGGNLAGAVTGSLLAGYYLLPQFDMPTATYVAVALNVLVALLALVMAARTPHLVVTDRPENLRPEEGAGVRVVYVAIALSGLTALGAEVVWTRILSLIFGATAYTFSLILAVFLVGLGIGSSAGAAIARNSPNPRAALGWCQLGVCVTLAWAAYASSASLPYWPINPSITSNRPWFNFQLDLMRGIWVMLPGAILWGASFPLALASVARPGQDSARLVGGVYAANTVGAIFGALLTGLVLIKFFGSQVAQQALIGVAALSGVLMLSSGVSAVPAPVLVVVVAIGAGLFARYVPQVPGILIAYGRYAATWMNANGTPMNEIIYKGEGITASVAVSKTPNGVLNYHNAGKVQASSEPQDMRLQRMLGHITTLVPKSPSRVLVIGCGAGVTAGAVSIDPLVTNQTIAEIEPLVPKVVSTYFAEHNFSVVTNPKVHVQFDDARHYLLTTSEKFDAVTSDPLDPWVKGAATLYTREFFNEVKNHLKPGGVVTLFVQLYESTEAAVKSEVATFLEAFPEGAVFANTSTGQGYDLVLFGQLGGGKINVDVVQARLNDPANAAIVQSLRQIGINSAVDLFGTYAGGTADMKAWLSDASINTDMNLRLQYLAGKGLNLYQADAIYRSMIRDSRYPEQLFEGSPQTLQALRARIQTALGGAPQF